MGQPHVGLTWTSAAGGLDAWICCVCSRPDSPMLPRQRISSFPRGPCVDAAPEAAGESWKRKVDRPPEAGMTCITAACETRTQAHEHTSRCTPYTSKAG